MGVVTVVLSPLLFLVYVASLLKAGVLGFRWHLRHGREGRRWLAVYSDGKKWKEHFEGVVIPMLGASAYVVNISAAPSWRRARSLERQVHGFWTGRSEHTPALVSPPGLFRRAKVIRLHSEYLRFAVHGDESALQHALARLRA